MIERKYSVRVKVKKKVGKIPKGTTATVPTDKEGTPLDYFWRKIFRDSKIDHSVEILDEKNTINTTQDKPETVKAKKSSQ